jgi:hypothetical protein
VLESREGANGANREKSGSLASWKTEGSSVKRTTEALQRDVDALVKESKILRDDALELRHIAAALKRRAESIQGALAKARRFKIN